jgi:hypothetical protein
MTLQKVNSYARHSKVSSRPKPNVKHIQHWNPETSELYNLRATQSSDKVWVNGKGFIHIQVDQIRGYEAGSMPLDIANYLKCFRSFILGMLKGGLGFVRCKSYEAAKRYSNLGGEVAMVTTKCNVEWGVIK